jgi:hypothetical protein
MSLNTQISLSFVSHETSSGDISTEMRVTPASYSLVLSDGTGANQSQIAWSKKWVIDDEDFLYLDALTDSRGTISFSAIKAIYIKNIGPDQVQIAGGASDDWMLGPFGAVKDTTVQGNTVGSVFLIPSGGVLFTTNPSAAGWPVTSVSNGLGFFASSGTGIGVTLDVVIVGEGTIS